MVAKRASVALWGAVILSAGCVHTPARTYTECLRPVEDVDVLAQSRNRVNVFLMNGADLLEISGMSELRDAITAAGFSKVYYAQRADREWFRREIHRLHREDADNRFVLVGYGAAADQLRELAVKLAGEQIALDSVVFIDPVGDRTDLTDCPFPSLVIRSHRWRLSPHLNTTETIVAHGSRHPNVPNAPATVQQLIGILTDSARKVPAFNPPLDCVPVIDPKKRVPRPTEPKAMPALPPEWRFLCPNGDGSCPG